MINETIHWIQDLPWKTIFKIGSILYTLLAVGVSLMILMNARSGSKALAYLALIALVPILGIIFYLSFGINHRKNKIYTRKILQDTRFANLIQNVLEQRFKEVSLEHKADLEYFYPLAKMIQEDARNIFADDNQVDLLINGEQKFPRLLEDLRNAKEHIHIQYYIYENDVIGNEIADILIEKHKAGVEVKFIYDDFGASNIRKTLVRRLNAAGVPNYPFYKIKLIALANRLNYRNHRKIVVIDNKIGYVGGINVADKYINKKNSKSYWRDTHLRIEGLSVLSLQLVFLGDWQFCADENIENITKYFPRNNLPVSESDGKVVQVISSGPDSNYPSILFALNRAILLSKKTVWLTTPYFIPEETLTDALIMASLSGINIKLLVPMNSDSAFVNTCATSHYEEMLQAGVEIYRYTKGFIHAKTMVCDDKIAFVGTANLDQRSFDLNFEVNAVVYNKELAQQLSNAFLEDLKYAEKLEYEEWMQRPRWRRLAERVLYLFSPLM
ncbi:MAG: cardiolipin synthase [Sphingobacteriales bacterium]|nr:MAG: cardiolipin synthase [Sphingobacteriales bacterium]